MGNKSKEVVKVHCEGFALSNCQKRFNLLGEEKQLCRETGSHLRILKIQQVAKELVPSLSFFLPSFLTSFLPPSLPVCLSSFLGEGASFFFLTLMV